MPNAGDQVVLNFTLGLAHFLAFNVMEWELFTLAVESRSPLSLLELAFIVKSFRVGGGVVAHGIIVSAQVQIFGFLDFGEGLGGWD